MGKQVELTNDVSKWFKELEINDGDFENLKPKIKEQIVKIEEVFIDYIKQQKEIEEKTKDNKLNRTNVILKAGLQRSSVYNSPNILKRYIDERISKIEKEITNHIIEDSKRQKEYSFLKDYLYKTQEHLLKNEILESKIEELENEVFQINKVNESLLGEICKLKEQLKEKENSIKQNKIVKLK